jgi:hypothetical protein
MRPEALERGPARGSDKLIAYVIQKAPGEHRVVAGKLVGHAVLSSGIVLAWRHGDDLGIL